LAEDTTYLAPTTRGERERLLGEGGPVLPAFGALRLDEITPVRLREWWSSEVTSRGRSTKTGRTYLDTLASVLA